MAGRCTKNRPGQVRDGEHQQLVQKKLAFRRRDSSGNVPFHLIRLKYLGAEHQAQGGPFCAGIAVNPVAEHHRQPCKAINSDKLPIDVIFEIIINFRDGGTYGDRPAS